MKNILSGLSPNSLLKSNNGKHGIKHILPNLKNLGSDLIHQNKSKACLSTKNRKNANTSHKNKTKERSQSNINDKAPKDVRVNARPFSVQNQRVYKLQAAKDKCILEKMNEMPKDNVFSYFRKLQAQEEINVCPHLQPNNIKPYLSTNGLYFPTVLKTRSAINLKSSFDCDDLEKPIVECSAKRYMSNVAAVEKKTIKTPTPSYTNKSPTIDIPHNGIATLTKNYSHVSHYAKDKPKKKPVPKGSDDVEQTVVKNRHSLSTGSINVDNKYMDLAKNDHGNKYPAFSEFIRGKEIETNFVRSLTNVHLGKNVRCSSVSAVEINKRGMDMLSENNQSQKIKGPSLPTSKSVFVSKLHSATSASGSRSSRRYTSVCPVIPTCASIKKIPRKKTLKKLTSKNCPPPVVEALKEVPLQKLSKLYEPTEPPKCEIEKPALCQRADDDLKSRPRSFGTINENYSSCAQAFQYKDPGPFARLPKKHVPEPIKKVEVPVDPCPQRADGVMKVSKFKLPNYESKSCPVKEVPIPPPILLHPLTKQFDVPEPSKCVVEKKEPCVRSDDNMKIYPKQLQCLNYDKLPKNDCVEGRIAPKLQRLTPRPVQEPSKCVHVVEKCTTESISDVSNWTINKSTGKIIPSRYSSHAKTLPSLKCPPLCPVKPDLLTEGEPLKRLPSYNLNLDRRECEKKLEEKCVRADDDRKVKSKTLPNFEAQRCVKSKPFKYKPGSPLVRLCGKRVPEPPRCAVIKEEPCQTPRADAGLIMTKKQLPNLPSNECPHQKIKVPEVVPMKRLPKYKVSEAPRVCNSKSETCQRLDDGLKVPMKDLPRLHVDEGCKPVPLKLHTGKPIQKLVPSHEICEPPKVCPKYVDKCIRADEDDWQYGPFAVPGKLSLSKCNAKNRKCNLSSTQKRFFSRMSSTSKEAYDGPCNFLRNSISLTLNLTSRKRYSTKKSTINMMPRRYSNDALQPGTSDIDKELQPKFPLLKRFLGIEETNPKVPKKIDAEELEDECVRKKYSIPNEGVTATCEEPCKSRVYLTKLKKCKTPEEDAVEVVTSCPKPSACCPPPCENCPEPFVGPDPCVPKRKKVCPAQKQKCKTWWQRVKEYFKARPNCPAPDEWKKRKLRTNAERAARKAGLYLVDPTCDAQKMCQEVKKVCSENQLQRRCYYTSCGDLIRSTKLFGIVYSRTISHAQRNYSSWRDPFEFYNFDEDDPGAKMSVENFAKEKKHIMNQLKYFDLDYLREELCRVLNTSDHKSSQGETALNRCTSSFRLECKSDELRAKNETLLQLLKVILANLENISSKKLNVEDADAAKTLKVLDDILDSSLKK